MPTVAEIDVLDVENRSFRPGQQMRAAANRFVNVGDTAGLVSAEVAEVTPDGSVSASLCQTSVHLDPGQAGFMVYNEVPTSPPPAGGGGGNGGGDTNGGLDRIGPVPDPPDEPGPPRPYPVPPMPPLGFRQPVDPPNGGPPMDGQPGNGNGGNGGNGPPPDLGRPPESMPPVDVCMARPADGNQAGEIQVVLPAETDVRFGFRVWGEGEPIPPFPDMAGDGPDASSKAAAWTASSRAAALTENRRMLLLGALAVGAFLYFRG